MVEKVKAPSCGVSGGVRGGARARRGRRGRSHGVSKPRTSRLGSCPIKHFTSTHGASRELTFGQTLCKLDCIAEHAPARGANTQQAWKHRVLNHLNTRKMYKHTTWLWRKESRVHESQPQPYNQNEQQQSTRSILVTLATSQLPTS